MPAGPEHEAEQAVSRHHMLPPIVYAPAPPKPKETKRRRGVGSLQGKRAADGVDETEETGEAAHPAPAPNAAALPQHSPPIEATERRVHSTTGKLSEGTLKAMLEVQERDSGQAAGDTTSTKDA
jgi:hypothetical protein